MGNFCNKSTETTLHDICVEVFLKFSDYSKPSQAKPIRIFNFPIGPALESVNLRKTYSKLHVRLLLWPKLPTYFGDVTTIENNWQVCVNIDAMSVVIFRIDRGLSNPSDQRPSTSLKEWGIFLNEILPCSWPFPFHTQAKTLILKFWSWNIMSQLRIQPLLLQLFVQGLLLLNIKKMQFTCYVSFLE